MTFLYTCTNKATTSIGDTKWDGDSFECWWNFKMLVTVLIISSANIQEMSPILSRQHHCCQYHGGNITVFRKTYFLNCKSFTLIVFLISVPDFSKAEMRFFNVGRSCFVILLSCFEWPFVVLEIKSFKRFWLVGADVAVKGPRAPPSRNHFANL